MKTTRATTSFLSLKIIFTAIVLLSFVGCAYNQASLDFRLKTFLQILTEDEKNLFIQGNLTNLVQKIDERLKTDETLQKKWQTIKQQETILLFSSRQVVEFFYQNFYLPTQKKSSKN